MLKKLLPLFVFFFTVFACTGTAQSIQNSSPQISISMSATEYLPADQIIFTININAEGDTPQSAFDLHKKRETILAGLLKKFDIPDQNIRFQPVRISKAYNHQSKNRYSQTNQQVSVTFSDFKIYEEIQLNLIENDFDSFNGSFTSSKIKEGKEIALKAAIETAKQRAILIASSSGVNLGSIHHISYSEYQINTGYRAEAAMAKISNDSMMDFEQTVGVTANISISFNIKS